jgi:hypothetical protein
MEPILELNHQVAKSCSIRNVENCIAYDNQYHIHDKEHDMVILENSIPYSMHYHRVHWSHRARYPFPGIAQLATIAQRSTGHYRTWRTRFDHQPEPASELWFGQSLACDRRCIRRARILECRGNFATVGRCSAHGSLAVSASDGRRLGLLDIPSNKILIFWIRNIDVLVKIFIFRIFDIGFLFKS